MEGNTEKARKVDYNKELWPSCGSPKGEIEEKNATPGLDFCENCVFMDEARFNLHTQINHGRSRKGTPAKGTISAAKLLLSLYLVPYQMPES